MFLYIRHEKYQDITAEFRGLRTSQADEEDAEHLDAKGGWKWNGM